MRYEHVKKYNESQFKRLVGIKPSTFERLSGKLRLIRQEIESKGGRKPKLSVEDTLLATLNYLREYRTFAHLAATYEIDPSNMYRSIKWCDDELIKMEETSIPGLKALRSKEYRVLTVDVTECTIERPKENQRDYYSGKKNDTQ